jgi:hypothetical protein
MAEPDFSTRLHGTLKHPFDDPLRHLGTAFRLTRHELALTVFLLRELSPCELKRFIHSLPMVDIHPSAHNSSATSSRNFKNCY